MRKIFLILSLLFLGATASFSQDYQTAIGLRGGFANGLTVKHFIGQKAAFEGILTSRWRGFSATGLYELHHEAFDVPRLKFYYGAGGHVGFWNGGDVNWVNDNDDYVVIGIDGILGLEYSLTEIPLNFSIDWKPAFNVVGYSGFWGDGGAISVRYILK